MKNENKDGYDRSKQRARPEKNEITKMKNTDRYTMRATEAA